MRIAGQADSVRSWILGHAGSTNASGRCGNDDYDGLTVTGTVVLVNDLPLPCGVKNAEEAGC